MPNTREKLIELLVDSIYENVELDDGYVGYEVNNEQIADYLIANGVTVQECVRGYWDVCNNNGNIQYRCPHCETVYVYMYKNHIAPDACKECGARLYLP
jgi:hypothetical protein